MATPFELVATIVKKMIARKDTDVFKGPVPWEEYGLTDYLQIVKVPMDLGTVQEKLKKKQYETVNDCGNDLQCFLSMIFFYWITISLLVMAHITVFFINHRTFIFQSCGYEKNMVKCDDLQRSWKQNLHFSESFQ